MILSMAALMTHGMPSGRATSIRAKASPDCSKELHAGRSLFIRSPWRSTVTSRLCPACRLPFLPDQIHLGEDDDLFVVFAVCGRCTARYRRLPPGTRHKLLNSALARACAAPSRYWCSTFPDQGAAELAARLLSHPRYVHSTLEALSW